MDEFRCGGCDACLGYRRKVWAARICLEAQLHPASSFATLTYAEDPWTLRKKDFQDFMKRFRWRLGDAKVRYFACGEYGDVSMRPHYHAMFFGVDAARGEQFVSESWQHGFIQVREFTIQRAMYLAGYVLKKMTRDDDERLEGREPEFRLCSLRPGIGRGAADVLASFYKSRVGQEELAAKGDVESAVRMDGQFWPLGRYVKGKIREAVGFEVNSRVRPDSELKRQVGAAAGVDVMDQYRAEQEAKRAANAAALKMRKGRKNASL